MEVIIKEDDNWIRRYLKAVYPNAIRLAGKDKIIIKLSVDVGKDMVEKKYEEFKSGWIYN